MARNPLIEDLNVALPASRRTGAFEIEDLAPKHQPQPRPLPRPPWICPLCSANFQSAEEMIEHNHINWYKQWQGPSWPRRLPRPPWVCPICAAKFTSAQAMLEHNHGPKGPIRAKPDNERSHD